MVRGETAKRDGTPYDPDDLSSLWEGLEALNRNPTLAPFLARGVGGDELARMLFKEAVVTLTGRIRGGVSFTQARNTPFQGLAADGAKLALWRLTREGFRVVAFIHDEVLIELPERDGSVDLARVEAAREAMCEAMAGVLGGDIPVACEATLSRCWSKDAGIVVRDGRDYPADRKEKDAGQLAALHQAGLVAPSRAEPRRGGGRRPARPGTPGSPGLAVDPPSSGGGLGRVDKIEGL